MNEAMFWGCLGAVLGGILTLGLYSIEGKAAQREALQDRLDAMEARIEALEHAKGLDRSEP